MQNSIILFDIDYTLFNVGDYRSQVFKKLQGILPDVPNIPNLAMEAYDEIRQAGWFEVKRFIQAFQQRVPQINKKKVEETWSDETLLTNSLYPEAEEVLVELSKRGYTLGIFSSGYTDFQKSKIAKIAHFFEKEHIHIHEMKDKKFPELIKKYKGKQITLIDDYIPVIEKAKQADPSITTVWMKRGRLSERVAPSKEFSPDYTITSLRELLSIIS